jgi:hypothetical protein
MAGNSSLEAHPLNVCRRGLKLFGSGGSRHAHGDAGVSFPARAWRALALQRKSSASAGGLRHKGRRRAAALSKNRAEDGAAIIERTAAALRAVKNGLQEDENRRLVE